MNFLADLIYYSAFSHLSFVFAGAALSSALNKKTSLLNTVPILTPGVNVFYTFYLSAQSFIILKKKFHTNQRDKLISTPILQLETISKLTAPVPTSIDVVFNHLMLESYGAKVKNFMSKKTPIIVLISEETHKLSVILKSRPNDPVFRYLSTAHEETFATIINTFNESRQIHGKIDEELLDMSFNLISNFAQKIYAREKELLSLEEQENKAVTDSLKGHLTFELEYQEKMFPTETKKIEHTVNKSTEKKTS